MFELTRQLEFSAAHRLHNPAFSDERNRELYGVCNNARGHGHNYVLEVTVRGPADAETGMVMDLNRLAQILQEVIFAAVSPLSEAAVADLEHQPFLIHKDIAEAIAAAFQLANAQRNPA